MAGLWTPFASMRLKARLAAPSAATRAGVSSPPPTPRSPVSCAAARWRLERRMPGSGPRKLLRSAARAPRSAGGRIELVLGALAEVNEPRVCG